MTRSSIGLYVFLPPGENERLIHEAHFYLITSADLTRNAAVISKRWYNTCAPTRGSRTHRGRVHVRKRPDFSFQRSLFVGQAPAFSIHVCGA